MINMWGVRKRDKLTDAIGLKFSLMAVIRYYLLSLVYHQKKDSKF